MPPVFLTLVNCNYQKWLIYNYMVIITIMIYYSCMQVIVEYGYLYDAIVTAFLALANGVSDDWTMTPSRIKSYIASTSFSGATGDIAFDMSRSRRESYCKLGYIKK